MAGFSHGVARKTSLAGDRFYTAPMSAFAPPVLKVALPLPLPRLFDYLPATGAQTLADYPIGVRVRVPFGNRELVGVVAAHGMQDADVGEPKPVLARLDQTPILHGELWQSLAWLAHYLHAPLGETLSTALPTQLRRGEPLPDTHRWGWQLTQSGRTALAGMRRGRPQAFASMLDEEPIAEEALDGLVTQWRSAARTLAARGHAQRVVMPSAPMPSPPAPGLALNPEQAAAAHAIAQARGFAPFLLDGVTGSGKTEVYLDAIAQCLARGRQALVLVPEIGLTPQMLERFRSRLGVAVHALHSGLNDGERAQVWAAAWRGQARVIVGTRSAVFVPLPEAGLIVIDEEHDGSYKQFDGIRYHARDFALVRAKALDVPIVLGSATPMLESLHNAQAGRYMHLRLTQRAGGAQPPQVRVLDVRKRPLTAGLSPELLHAIEQALAAGGQVLVFKNRRGYAPVLLCHDCGWSAQCPRCDAAMTVHGGGKRLQCHHCGLRRGTPPACPDCGSLALQPQGVGTERLEEVLAEKFPHTPTIRIDRTSTQRRDALQKHFAALGAQPGILIGTQMLAKGHDLANLTLVAVVGVDEGLFSADFRSREKLAQLLIQVAGRAGRADKPGLVLLQTHHPQHLLLQTLLHGGYHAFAIDELARREAAGFPPFAHLALLRAEAQHAEAPLQFLSTVKSLLLESRADHAAAADAAGNADALLPFALHGPLAAPMPRRAGYRRMQLLLSAASRGALHRALDALLPQLHGLPQSRRVRWSLDVDPVDLY